MVFMPPPLWIISLRIKESVDFQTSLKNPKSFTVFKKVYCLKTNSTGFLRLHGEQRTPPCLAIGS